MKNNFKHKQSVKSEERNGYFFEFDEHDRNTYHSTPRGYWCYNFFHEPVNGKANPVPYKSFHKYWNYYNNMNLNVEELCKFGKVEKFELIDGKFHVLITKGFDTSIQNTLDCMNIVIMSSVGDEYPTVDKYVTDENYFELILKNK